MQEKQQLTKERVRNKVAWRYTKKYASKVARKFAGKYGKIKHKSSKDLHIKYAKQVTRK